MNPAPTSCRETTGRAPAGEAAAEAAKRATASAADEGSAKRRRLLGSSRRCRRRGCQAGSRHRCGRGVRHERGGFLAPAGEAAAEAAKRATASAADESAKKRRHLLDFSTLGLPGGAQNTPACKGCPRPPGCPESGRRPRPRSPISSGFPVATSPAAEILSARSSRKYAQLVEPPSS
jgi:hypothetical protein